MKASRGVPGLIAATLGVVIMAFSFVNGISAALDDSSDGAGAFVVLFLFGAALVLVALVMAIVRLVQGRSRALSIVTLVIAAVPVATIIYLLTSS